MTDDFCNQLLLAIFCHFVSDFWQFCSRFILLCNVYIRFATASQSPNTYI